MIATPINHSPYQRAVGVFENCQNAEAALQELRNAGFDMNRVFVIALDTPIENDLVSANSHNELLENKTNKGAATRSIAGEALGGITGLFMGVSELAISGISSLFLARETKAIASTVSGGAIDSLIGALIGLGIPEEKTKVSQERRLRGYYLVRVYGTPNEIARAETILQNWRSEEWGVY